MTTKVSSAMQDLTDDYAFSGRVDAVNAIKAKYPKPS